MYCYLKTNLGVIALSKDEMERVRLPQKLCHAEGKTIDEIATLLYISGMSAARLVGYHMRLSRRKADLNLYRLYLRKYFLLA